ncbi:SET domain-containing protein-lysine N-methyltransferase [Sphingomonas ginkgonis]|uniref:SET domain-containing protein-lysine N-methyltransferase n=1 Tax=Sphingomonas ginkgonis TaxID=2315330 RepID=UPI000F876547|nr:SET domain-containing protein [Sphingomonas ginkgonis]
MKPSSIHGIGVFLTEPVSRGQLIWRFDSRIDRVYSDHEIAEMPAELRAFLRTYSTFHEGQKLWVLCGDNGRHFNHSDDPNTASLGIAFGDDVAMVELPAGTELTSDYRTICDAIRRNGADYSQPHELSSLSSPAISLSPMS